jgi:hypothetical protein
MITYLALGGMRSLNRTSANVQVVQVAVSDGAEPGSMDALNALPPMICDGK